MLHGYSYPLRASLIEKMLKKRLKAPSSLTRHLRVGGRMVLEVAADIIEQCKASLQQASTPISSAPMDSSAGNVPVIIID